ncbi:MAG: cell division protein ZapE [Rickettsiales bacterium]
MTQATPTHFIDVYDAHVAAHEWRADPAQRAAAFALTQLEMQLMDPESPSLLGDLAFWRKDNTDATGLYVWGDVGRGKSMLVDRFVAHLKPRAQVRRVHFHALMLEVHKRLHQLRQQPQHDDVMQQIVVELAHGVQLLCLDEFQVTDVTDAMLLSRLFGGLFEAGVAVVFTSNRPPRELYQGGLQREQFLKFVDLLEAHMPILHINGPQDYRLGQLRALKRTYMYPRNEAADDFLLESWQQLVGNAPSEPLWLEVQGRILRIDKHARGVAWLTFNELCARPLGANDYLSLAKVCHTLLLQGIPLMTPESRNEAKRFVTLIDTLYDQHVKLIATAEAPPDALYPTGDGSFEFHRTVSRLIEMQSEAYLAMAHTA